MVSICFFLSEAAHSGEKCVESLLISTSSHQGAGNVYNYNDFMKNNWMKSSSAAIGTQFWQQRWWQWCFWWYHSLLAGRQYIIELLLKGLHRLKYRGYDRFFLMNDDDVVDMISTSIGDDDEEKDIWWHAINATWNAWRKYAKNSQQSPAHNFCEAMNSFHGW